MILVVVGVLSIFVAARMRTTVEQTRAFYDQLLSQVQYARKVAVAQRRATCVHIDAAQSRLFYSNAAGNACPAAAGVSAPTGEVPFTVPIPAGTTATAAVFQFDGLGRYRTAAGAATAAALVLSVTGDGNYQVTVEHDTGYVR